MTTIGVAIAVPEPWGTRLQDYRKAIGDETADAIPTHITLLPPVDVDDSLLGEIERHLTLAARQHTPFSVRLRGTGTFRPVSPVVFVGVVRGISECEQLAGDVRRGPLGIDVQFPYHPHVTIAHDLGDDVLDQAFDEQDAFDATFVVDGFHLYLHLDDRGWTPHRRFLLSVDAEQVEG